MPPTRPPLARNSSMIWALKSAGDVDIVFLGRSTLRYWESRGVLTAHRRRHGQRRYGPEALERVALIEIAKRAGFTLAEIQVLLAGLSDNMPPPEVWEQLAQRKLPEIERKLAETQAIKRMLEEGLQCRCVTLQDCLGWASPTDDA
ncbi:MAG TPA: MerR family DNA-binding protein [Solirubrobacteraceae bacterium]|nr:MerR family DNA-binding protein [Solirubrobacteraceae bacterium]